MSIKEKFKSVGKGLWTFLDGPDQVGPIKTKKARHLAREEVVKRKSLYSDRVDHWKQEFKQEKERAARMGKRKESFAEAMNRFNLTEDDVKAIEIALRKKARVEWYLLVASGVGVLTAVLFAPLMAIFSSLFMATIINTLHVKTTFRLWQVEKRELLSFKNFLKDSGIKRVYQHV